MTTTRQKKSRQIQVRVPPELGEKVVAAARGRDVSINEWINRAISHAILHHESADGAEPEPLRLPWSAIL